MNTNKKIDSIQILRGLAALSVVMFHYRFYLVSDNLERNLVDRFFGWGSVGVDLFFVISGFIMFYISRDKLNGLSASLGFLINRSLRILPTYYIILLFAFLTGGAMSTFHYPDKIANLLSALSFHPYLTKPAPLYIPDNGMYNIRWTLNYEVYFYIVFSFCLLFKKRMIVLAAWFLMPSLFAFFAGKGFTLSASGYDFNLPGVRLITNPIVLEFGIGVLCGYTYVKLKEAKQIILIPLSLLFISLFILLICSFGLRGYNLISACAFYFLILSLSLQENLISKLRLLPLVFIGDISFSLYLIHNPISSALSGKVENYNPELTHGVSWFLFLISVSVFFAWLSHKYIEVKLTKKIRSLIMNQSK